MTTLGTDGRGLWAVGSERRLPVCVLAAAACWSKVGLVLFGSSVSFHSVSCLGAIYFSACRFVTAGSLYKCASRVSGSRRDIGSSDLSRNSAGIATTNSKNWRRNSFNLGASLHAELVHSICARPRSWMKLSSVARGSVISYSSQ